MYNRQMQTKIHSLIESVANVAIGYSVAIFSQLLIFPLFDIEVSFSQNLQMGLLFTIISLIRSFALRRVFNKITTKQMEGDC